MYFVSSAKVRPWKDEVPKIVSLDNAYRPRKNEEDMVPHSFVFRRRESFLAVLRCVSMKLFHVDFQEVLNFC